MHVPFNEPDNRFMRCPAWGAKSMPRKGPGLDAISIISEARGLLAPSAQYSGVDLVVICPRGQRTTSALTYLCNILKHTKYILLQACQIGSEEVACLKSEVLSGMPHVAGPHQGEQKTCDETIEPRLHPAGAK